MDCKRSRKVYIRKEVAFLIIQFLLFMLYFIDLEWFVFSVPFFVQYLFISLMILGVLTLFFGILNLKENTWFIISSRLKVKTDNLIDDNVFLTEGIYQFIRHPIYAGILLLMISYSFLDASIFKILITFIMAMVLFYKSILEEMWLFTKYRNFRLYKQRTGRFFPKLPIYVEWFGNRNR